MRIKFCGVPDQYQNFIISFWLHHCSSGKLILSFCTGTILCMNVHVFVEAKVVIPNPSTFPGPSERYISGMGRLGGGGGGTKIGFEFWLYLSLAKPIMIWTRLYFGVYTSMCPMNRFNSSRFKIIVTPKFCYSLPV